VVLEGVVERGVVRAPLMREKNPLRGAEGVDALGEGLSRGISSMSGIISSECESSSSFSSGLAVGSSPDHQLTTEAFVPPLMSSDTISQNS
jgi:hypothetical protein